MKMRMGKFLTAAALAGSVAFAGGQVAQAAAVNDVLSGLVNEAGDATGRGTAKVQFEDVTWTFDPYGLANAGSLPAPTPVYAFFSIDNVGWHDSEFLDPAGVFTGTKVSTSTFGIFGILQATVSADWESGQNRLSLTDVDVQVRKIDNAQAPSLSASDTLESALQKFGGTGDFAASFGIRSADDFYDLLVDPFSGNITGFQLGLSLIEQENFPAILPGLISLGTEHHIFGEGIIARDASGEPGTTGPFVQGKGDFATMMLVPTPAAALPGMALCGLLFARRRRNEAIA